ncbi:transmembrane protein (macronuclear) [Tetrahymena thermophila SB210]|uniref:Transmembrane protein n=1 Tax=Tetrahymena thermophila (strain SB210) TaxID=312017 RepID=Q24GC1_TETTS|nr:transmembrane protein [Tetrahymena thermophila SB210]EAS06809.2 transmembrane protein [Tetrahymena thermophila SB210]|eukprot:XP_001027051.2 transmembrane protein [Tetrahymena thermophila SB210]
MTAQLQNNQLLYQREAKLLKSSYINNKINLEASLILLNNLDQVTLDYITLKLNKLNQNTFSSFIQVNQCYNITLAKCTLDINFSAFVVNQAVLSTGGAINLSKVNLILKNSQIESNKAQIGGGIYYQQIVPDFVLLIQKGIKQNNTIQNNYASIYVLDEEGTPVFIPSIQNQSSLSDDVLLIIRQINIEITCDQLNVQQIQCVGNLKSSDYQNGGFYLTVQPMYKPLSTMIMKIRSNVFPQLVDSNNNIQINQGQLDLQVLLNFDQCKIGQIQKQFSNSIICESCPEGKYSLDILDGECKKCPDSADYCSGSKIQLKNGYWRSNEFTDDIIYCNYNPDVCQPQSNKSKFNCARGYIGMICRSCDIYGQIWEDSQI